MQEDDQELPTEHPVAAAWKYIVEHTETTVQGGRPETMQPIEAREEPVETDEVTYQEKLRFSQRIKNLSQ